MADFDVRDPWLVAAWPGMGAVALLAADHLAKTLGARQVEDVSFDAWFDVQAVPVAQGLFRAPKRPKHVLFAWRNPDPAGRDLLIFLAEAQPEGRSWAFCEALLDRLDAAPPTRVVTFAAMASPRGPQHAPGVVAAATAPHLLGEVQPNVAAHLSEGEVGGLNGLLPAVASERGIDGLCLLGEIPFFAANMPNPRASVAVLRAFSAVSGIPVDTEALEHHADEMDRRMQQLFAGLRDAAAGLPAEPQAAEDAEPEAQDSPSEQQAEEGLAERDRARIEELFEATARNRKHALGLKSELDRLGVYRTYEDRFLDLFRRGD